MMSFDELLGKDGAIPPLTKEEADWICVAMEQSHISIEKFITFKGMRDIIKWQEYVYASIRSHDRKFLRVAVEGMSRCNMLQVTVNSWDQFVEKCIIHMEKL